MAKLSDIVIFDQNLGFDSGAAFLLQQYPQINERIKFTSGWEVEIFSGVPYIVVRGKGATDTTIFDAALEYIQKGLDRIAVRTGTALSTHKEIDHYLLLWCENSINHLRIIDVYNAMPQLRAEVYVSGVSMNSTSSQSLKEYHESLRYIREAFSCTNAFDVYRYMYLALECLCSSIQPKTKKGSEKEWFIDVLTKQLCLLKQNPNLFQKHVIEEIYKTRCKIFHAKDGESKLLTHNLKDIETLYKNLNDLIGVVKVAVKEILGMDMNMKPLAKYLTGARISQEAFNAIAKVFSHIEIYASDQESLLSDLNPDEASDLLTEASNWLLDTKYYSPYLKTSQRAVIGVKHLDALQKTKPITGFLLKNSDELYGTIGLKAPLDCEHIDQLEVVFCLRANLI
jgi:hypothetical protein